jgi:integrase
MRKPRIQVKPYPHSETHKFIVDLRPFGKGRKFFKTRSEADAEALRHRTLLERHSSEAVGLSKRELSEIISAKHDLAKYGETITSAAKHRIDHLERVLRHSITVAQLAQEVLEAKRKDGLSARYISMLRSNLNRFSQDFGDRSIAAITVEELDHWLRSLPGSPKTRTGYRTNLGVLFSYAVKLRMLGSNPVLFTARPKLIDRPPEIFTIDELRALLEAAFAKEPSVVPMLAIGAFAGLREAEIQRLDWNEIARGHIEVTAAKAKSARRRIVPIQPNLAAWLRPYSGLKGLVVPKGQRKKLRHARAAAGLLKWPSNGLRHSFASYRLAAIQDAPRVSAELGHTAPQLLYNTYRELVHPEEAERYWRILPPTEENIVGFQADQS